LECPTFRRLLNVAAKGAIRAPEIVSKRGKRKKRR
jgi:hypothetical protein